MCPRSNAHGFTLLEVLAALLIAAVSVTYLIQSETASLRMANGTRDLRDATLLGQAKLQELAAGLETGAAGDFEERQDWTWEALRETVPEGFGTQKIVLTVHYVSMGTPRLVTLEQLVR
jgi:prepilin-type N-terminal cleavage/methylation domain-containing protein